MAARIKLKDLPEDMQAKLRKVARKPRQKACVRLLLRGTAHKFVAVQIPWPPSVNHYYHGGRYLRKEVRTYREAVAEACLEQKVGHVIGKDVRVIIFAFAPDGRRRDCDNILKGSLDALVKARVIDDDSHISSLEVRRSNTTGAYLAVHLEGDLPKGRDGRNIPENQRRKRHSQRSTHVPTATSAATRADGRNPRPAT